MPQIGNVFIPDSALAAMPMPGQQADARPGFFGAFKGGAEQAYAGLRYGLPFAIGQATGSLTDADRAGYVQALQAANQAAAKTAPASLQDVTSGRAGVTDYIKENLGAMIPQAAAMIAGGIAGSAVGPEGTIGGALAPVAGAVIAGTPGFAGQNVQSIVGNTGGLTKEQAERSLAIAPLQAGAAESAGYLTPGVGRLLGSTGEAYTGNLGMRIAKSMAATGAGQAAAGAAMEAGTQYAQGDLGYNPDSAGRIVDAAVGGLAIGGFLGTFGGFKRSRVDMTPASELKPDDLAQAADTIVKGNDKFTPYGLLPPPTDFIVDSQGNAVRPGPEAERDLVLERNRPVPRVPEAPPTPEQAATVADLLAGSRTDLLGNAPAAPQVPLGSEASPRGLAGFADLGNVQLPPAPEAPVGEVPAAAETPAAAQAPATPRGSAVLAEADKPLVPPANVDHLEPSMERPLANAPLADLTKAMSSKAAIPDELGAEIARETELRKAELTGAIPTDDATFKARLDEAKEGLRGSWISKLDAKTPQELVDKVFTEIFDEQSQAAAPNKLAQRLGLLDADGKPTQWANDMLKARDDAEQAQIAAEREARKAGAAQPAPEAPAPAAEAPAPAAETKAKGKSKAKQPEEAPNPEISQPKTLDPVDQLRTMVDMLRTSDKDNPAVLTKKEADEIHSLLDAKQVEAANTRLRDIIDAKEKEAAPETPAEAPKAEAPAAPEPEVMSKADLRKAALDAARQRAVEEREARKTKSDEPLPSDKAASDAANAREQARVADVADAQARAKAADEAAAAEPENNPVENSKFPTDHSSALRDIIEKLREAGSEKGGLTDAEAQRGHDLIDAGRLDEAMKHVETALDQPPEARPKIGKDKQVEMARGGMWGKPDAGLADAINGKSVSEAAKHMADNAPSRFHRAVMDAVSALSARLEKAGTKTIVKVAKEGDRVPSVLNRPGTNGVMVSKPLPHGNSQTEVHLMHPELRPDSGTSYLTAAHEMLHVVTHNAIDNVLTGRITEGPVHQAVMDLQDLLRAVVKNYRDNKANLAPELLHPMEQLVKGGANGLANVHELVSWGLTHPEMQDYLQTIQYTPKQTAFGRFVELLRNMLGLEGARMDSALTELARASNNLLRPKAADLDTYRGLIKPKMAERMMLNEIKSPEEADSAVGKATAKISEMADKIASRTSIDAVGIGSKIGRAMLGWMSQNGIDRAWGADNPGLLQRTEALRMRASARSFMQRIGSQTYTKFEQLDPANQTRLSELMATSSQFRVDPLKSFDQHTWFDPKFLASIGQTAENMEAIHKRAVDVYNTLRRQNNGEAAALYMEMRNLNRMQVIAQMSVGLDHMVAGDQYLKVSPFGRLENPMDVFLKTIKSSDTAAALKYWEDTLANQTKLAKDYLAATRGEINKLDEKQQGALRDLLLPIDNSLNHVEETLKGLDEAPYFHLGRYGERFGTAKVAVDEAGVIKPESQEAVAKALKDNGFGFAMMSPDNKQPRFMLRFSTEAQGAAFRRVMQDLVEQGHIQGGEDEAGNPNVKEGPRNDFGDLGLNTGAVNFMSRMADALDTSKAFQPQRGMTDEDIKVLEAQKRSVKNMMNDVWLDMQPDAGLSRVMTYRQTRPGFDRDMVRNWMTRWNVGSYALANMSTMGRINEAYARMNDAYLNAQAVPAKGETGASPDEKLALMREMQMRDAKNPVNPLADTFDRMRGYTHSYFLGFSPAYVLTQLAQVASNGLPELAKKYGYAKSFAAMRTATKDANNIMRAVFQEMGPLPLSHKADALTISDRVLDRANLTPEMRDFMTHMMATGTIDIGSMSRAALQAGRGSEPGSLSTFGKHADMIAQLASAPGMATETYTRLIVALAARQLHGDFSQAAKEYASKSVRESMFDFQSYNTARQLSKKGLMGPMTPIVAQFMSYSTQMMEKLHAEMLDAFAGPRAGESAAEAADRKAAARKFLIGHTAAITTLAGTMGMPFATVGAALLEKMVRASGVTGNQDWDATAAYRDFLSSVLGKDIGEVVARGVPRAFGIDMSGRVGEQNLLPMSSFIASKRGWKDAINDEIVSGAGAMPSMFGLMVQGSSQFLQGDFIGGAKTFMPTALKGPIETYRMATNGYVDSKGQRMPISPTAMSYLAQLLGYTPAGKAEYSEARTDENERRQVLQSRSQAIRQDIINAVMDHDAGGVQAGIKRAVAFDKDNIGFAVMPTLARAVERAQQQRALSVATQSPVGTPIRDIAGQRLTRYANVQYQE